MSDEDNQYRIGETQVDAGVLSAMQRVKLLLNNRVCRERLVNELSPMLDGLMLDRCAFWKIEGDVAVAVYRYARAGAALGLGPARLTREQDAWLFECATSSRTAKMTDSGLIRFAAPWTAAKRNPQVFLLMIERLLSDGDLVSHHSDDSLRFMSDILCALFCYAFPDCGTPDT